MFNIHIDIRNVKINLKKIFCLFVYLFVRKITKNTSFQLHRRQRPFTSPTKGAISGTQARLIRRRRSMYPLAKDTFTSMPKAAIHRPVHVAFEGGDVRAKGPSSLRAEGPFTSSTKAAMYRPKVHSYQRRRRHFQKKGPFNHGPKAHFPAGQTPVHVVAEGGE